MIGATRMQMGRFCYWAAADGWGRRKNVTGSGLLVDDRWSVVEGYRSVDRAFASLLRAYAQIAADFPVDELERVCHGVSYVGQAEEKQGYSNDGIEDGDHFAPRSFWGNVAVT